MHDGNNGQRGDGTDFTAEQEAQVSGAFTSAGHSHSRLCDAQWMQAARSSGGRGAAAQKPLDTQRGWIVAI